MKWIKENVETIVSVLVMIGLIAGGIAYFAKAEDLKLVDMRLEQKIVNDAVYDLTREVTYLEGKYGNSDCSTWRGPEAERDRNQYKKLKEQLEAIKIRRSAIIQSIVRGKK